MKGEAADRAYVVRELQRFIKLAGIRNLGQLQVVMPEMRRLAVERGLSEAEIERLYDADGLYDLYLEYLARRH